ncbi:MAG: hypothetical protein LIP77_05230 [Planctomycetes bacterium]|nr:hypothetical protein [Planctomycetota bacterium]
MRRAGYGAILAWLSFTAILAAGEGPIPEAELQALDRAIAREMHSGNLGSQTLGDLRRLKQRLVRLQATAVDDRDAALQPLDGDATRQELLARLEAEARTGGRPARRSLALYYLFLNQPEKAREEWQRMGRATGGDVPWHTLAGYLDAALGEYRSGRDNLETALRLLESRTSLTLSAPEFCTAIAGYRIHVPREPGDLLPGEDVLIYVEIEGTEFLPAAEGGQECRLMFGLHLRSDSQSTVWAEPRYGEYAPVFSGPIRDLHAALTWRIPNDLAPGRYHLTVEAVEDSSMRRGESQMSFSVGRRDTNPERRVTGGLAPGAVGEAERVFQGGLPGGGSDVPLVRDSEFFGRQNFELQRQLERMQRVE